MLSLQGLAGGRAARGLFCLLLSLLLPGPALAAGPRIDQVQPVFSGGLSIRAGATQTLVAGLGGGVVRVDVPLCSFSDRSVVALALTAQGRGHLRRATARLAPRSDSGLCAWQTFAFQRPLEVSRGDVLALTLGAVRGQPPLWGANALHDDPYPRGKGAWMGHVVDDFAFRTYVQPAGRR
jgi:hypothetical protein